MAARERRWRMFPAIQIISIYCRDIWLSDTISSLSAFTCKEATNVQIDLTPLRADNISFLQEKKFSRCPYPTSLLQDNPSLLLGDFWGGEVGRVWFLFFLFLQKLLKQNNFLRIQSLLYNLQTQNNDTFSSICPANATRLTDKINLPLLQSTKNLQFVTHKSQARTILSVFICKHIQHVIISLTNIITVMR